MEPTYCLMPSVIFDSLPCLNTGAWAAWIQAFGSVGAIWFAGKIARDQFQKERVLVEEARRHQRLDRKIEELQSEITKLKMIQTVAAELAFGLQVPAENAAKSQEDFIYTDFIGSLDRLKVSVDFVKRLPGHELTDTALVTRFVWLQTHAGWAVEAIDHLSRMTVESLPAFEHMPQFRSTVIECAKRVAEIRDGFDVVIDARKRELQALTDGDL